jgi:cytoskeletal protein RodZ
MKKRSATVTGKIMFFFLVLIIVVFMFNSHAPVFAEESSGSSAASTDTAAASSSSETVSTTDSSSGNSASSETASATVEQTGAATADEAAAKIIENYKFDAGTSLILVQPAVCYITTIYSAYVFDPVINQWSNDKFIWGPFNGTGFVVNPETGNIITSGDLVDDRETNEVALKNAILDAYIFETYPDDYNELSDTDWTTIYNGFNFKGENSDTPDREVWVQFNTATVSIPDSSNNNFIRAEVVSVSDSNQGNIAVLKITPTIGRALSSTLIGDSSKIEIADPITIMGYPWTADYGQDDALSPTVVKGSISGKKMVNGKSVFQALVYAVEGNSGSPVFAEDGSIIGMLTTGTDNMTNFLRPSNEIKLIFEGENKLGPVDKEWRAGLALYMQNHYSEAIKHFNAVLNLSSGHLLAQEYKAKAQSNMGSDVPITAETAPATVAETTIQETVPPVTAMETTSLVSSLMSFGLFGLSPLYTYLIFGGTLLLLILLIVLIAVLFKRRKPKKTGPDVIIAKGPIYIASAQPPVALNQAASVESKVKMIETSGEQTKAGMQTPEPESGAVKADTDRNADEGVVKDSAATGTVKTSETGAKEFSKKGKKSKDPVSPAENETDEKNADEKKADSGKKKFCVNCGTQVLDTNVFCANCGNKLK